MPSRQALYKLSVHLSPWGVTETNAKCVRIAGCLVLFALTVLSLTVTATATDFYMSPSGNDASPGTTQQSPWKTFAHAIPKLNPGDTLNLMSGTYGNSSGTGYPLINCSSGAHNGTAAAPITVQAVNERQAFIKGTGAQEVVEVFACSYWNIVGLHAESADLPLSNTYTGDVFAVFNSNHIQLRRNIAARNNRYGNVHPILLQNTSNSLVEENEVYYFHRWGILVYGGSSNNEVRRNYVNGRGYDNISGGYPNGGTMFAIGPYDSNGNLFENNIEENTGVGINVEGTASNNKILGNISGPGLTFGTRIGPHSGMAQSTGNVFINSVSIRPATYGFWGRSSKSSYQQSSTFGSSNSSAGFVSDTDSCCSYSSYAFAVSDSIATGLTTGTGFKIVNVSGNTFSFNTVSAFNTAVTFSPASNVTNAIATNPGLGACYLWIPSSSPLKGAGSGGGDVGANIVFEYEGGSLTGQPLWDSSTGAPLFKGAIVAGLNDVAGTSLFDVANRFNINKNGCTLPDGGTSVASAPAAPSGLTAVVQ